MIPIEDNEPLLKKEKSYTEEDKSRLKREQEKEAIALAIEGQWRKAVAVNKAILELFPSDTDAHNRLGKALMELGEYAESRQAYSRALEIDPYNAIARKNLERLSYLGERQSAARSNQHKVAPHLFVEEAGKAGIVNLIQLAPREVLAKMAAGDPVVLRQREQGLIVENAQEEYLGQVEPKRGSRLIRLMSGGNRYTAAIASIGVSEVRVLIRETFQHPSQTGLLSFPPRAIEGFRPYTRESVLKYELEEEGEEPAETEEEEGVLPEETESFEIITTVAEEEAEPDEEAEQ